MLPSFTSAALAGVGIVAACSSTLHAASFAQGRFLFKAIIFADRVRPEVVEPFFAGLKFE